MGAVDWDEAALVEARREYKANAIKETNSPAGQAKLNAEMDARMEEARRQVDLEFQQKEANAAIVGKQLEECSKANPVLSLADRVLEWNGMAVQSSGPVSDALLEACEVIDELRRSMDLERKRFETMEGCFSALAYNVQLMRAGFERACELADKQ